MSRYAILIPLLIGILNGFCSAANTVAGIMLGRRMYWDADNLATDTVGFAAALKAAASLDLPTAKSPRQACDFADAQGKTFCRLKDPNAVSVAILCDAGYRLMALTQWTGMTETDIKVASHGMDTQYMKRRLLSDAQWEIISRAEVSKPSKTAVDLAVILHFDEAGQSSWLAKETVGDAGKAIEGTTAGVVMEYDRGVLNEDITIKRTIRAIYIILGKDEKTQSVIKAIEKGMDKLQLDLSYKAPEMVRVACGKGR